MRVAHKAERSRESADAFAFNVSCFQRRRASVPPDVPRVDATRRPPLDLVDLAVTDNSPAKRFLAIKTGSIAFGTRSRSLDRNSIN